MAYVRGEFKHLPFLAARRFRQRIRRVHGRAIVQLLKVFGVNARVRHVDVPAQQTTIFMLGEWWEGNTNENARYLSVEAAKIIQVHAWTAQVPLSYLKVFSQKCGSPPTPSWPSHKRQLKLGSLLPLNICTKIEKVSLSYNPECILIIVHEQIYILPKWLANKRKYIHIFLLSITHHGCVLLFGASISSCSGNVTHAIDARRGRVLWKEKEIERTSQQIRDDEATSSWMRTKKEARIFYLSS